LFRLQVSLQFGVPAGHSPAPDAVALTLNVRVCRQTTDAPMLRLLGIRFKAVGLVPVVALVSQRSAALRRMVVLNAGALAQPMVTEVDAFAHRTAHFLFLNVLVQKPVFIALSDKINITTYIRVPLVFIKILSKKFDFKENIFFTRN